MYLTADSENELQEVGGRGVPLWCGLFCPPCVRTPMRAAPPPRAPHRLENRAHSRRTPCCARSDVPPAQATAPHTRPSPCLDVAQLDPQAI